LGFATLENLQYLEFVTSGEALARGFAGPVIHMVFASIWGYHIGRAYLRQERLVATILLALGGTALLHGIYDYLVIALPRFALLASALLVLGIWIWRMFLIRDLHVAARNHNDGLASPADV
jgi:RsiW-degrading membrane proteinase PrsW (M82 family)